MNSRLRREGYTYSTENSYCDWVKRYVEFHGIKSRSDMRGNAPYKAEQFLIYLAVNQNVSPYTQNQALNALFNCYSKVLESPFSESEGEPFSQETENSCRSNNSGIT
ncbi:site-specific integrase [Thiomicrorhabdus sp.]|uniref:site-specific integrase n=1 Tax=Thiomicrorhabdus sp. TaxID=2039724 RepID=UPI0029C6CAEF|nr:site-specific integrase [Thiomicrorhabdus sp.]